MPTFACTCGKNLKVDDQLAGKKVKCPACGQVTVVPQLVGVTPVGGSTLLSQGGPANAASAAGADGHTAPRPSQADATRDENPTRSGQQSNLSEFLAPPQGSDEIGRLGGFRILSILGHGGMGVVFLAEDLQLRRKVAIKAMLPHLAQSRSAQQRFLREARAAAALEHESIVPIHQVGEDRGVPFIVMPFLRGEPLEGRLHPTRTCPLELIVQVGTQIADALSTAHAQGLLHRDIKPANIWLETASDRLSASGNAPSWDTRPTSSAAMSDQSYATVPGATVPDAGADPPSVQRVKLLDFGLARLAAVEENEHLTQSGAILGTPGYMPPEQVDGQELDGRADLFSLGCVLYRMAAGQAAFPGSTVTARLVAVSTLQPQPPALANSTLPAALSDLIMQLLAKKRDERPRSASEVAERLRALNVSADATTQAAKDTMTGATPVPVADAGAAPARRSRGPLIAVGLVIAAAIVAAIVLFWQTPHGMVRIESDDPDVEIVFGKDGPTIKGADKQPITLRAGEHGILIRRGDFSFETDKLLIEKGKTITLKIELLKGRMQVVHDGKVLGGKDLPGKKDDGIAKVDPKKKEEPKALPPTFKNSIDMEFVLVPKGKFLMGGGGGKVGDKEVEIDYDFYLAKYEVTQEEWVKVMKANPSAFSRAGKERNKVADIDEQELKRFPVDSVSWNDCQEFVMGINELEKPAGWKYRLPTEAEWEYACRGGPTTNKLDFGFDYYFDRPTNTLLPDRANFLHEESMKRTCKVGSYPPNVLGLYEMHGNVREWCADEIQGDSKDTNEASKRMNRGGSWNFDSRPCRAADRGQNPRAYRSNSRGLRVARVPIDKGDIGKLDPPPDEDPRPPLKPLPLPGAWTPPPIVPIGQSPFDKLDPKAIPADERFEGQPPELVAVIGTHAHRTWNRAVNAVVSSDGRLLATRARSPLTVWDLATRARVMEVAGGGGEGLGGAGGGITFTPDGKRLVLSAGPSKLLQTVDLLRPPGTFSPWPDGPAVGAAMGIHISSDNKRCITFGYDNSSIRFWDLTTSPAKLLHQIDVRLGDARNVAITADGKRLAYSSWREKEIVVVDIIDTEVKERWRLDHKQYAGVPAGRLCISPDGNRLSSTGHGTNRRLWDLTKDPPTFVAFGPSQGYPYTDMPFSPDSKHVFTHMLDGSIQMWDVTASQPKEVWKQPFRALPGQLLPLPDNKTLAVYSQLGLVQFIDISGPEPKLLNPLEPAEPGYGGIVVDQANGRVALTRAFDRRSQWWDLTGNKPVATDLLTEPDAIAFTPDGRKQVLDRNGKFVLFQKRDEKTSSTAPLEPLSNPRFTSSGEVLWYWTKSGLKGLDLRGEKPQPLTSPPPAANAAGVAAALLRNDSLYPATAGKLFSLWDVSNLPPKRLFTWPADFRQSLSRDLFPAGDKLLAAPNSKLELHILTPDGWQPVWSSKEQYYNFDNSVVTAVHPTGKWYAAATGGKVTLWRSDKQQVVTTWNLKSRPQRLEFAPDGRHLFIATGHQTIYVLRLNQLADK